MLYAIASAIVMLALLDRVTRQGRVELVKLEAIFALRGLQDEIVEGVIDGRIANEPDAERLYDAIGSCLSSMPTLHTPLYLIGIILYDEMTGRDDGAGAPPAEQPPLREIRRRWMLTVNRYVRRRHTTTVRVVRLLGGAGSGLSRLKDRVWLALESLPEALGRSDGDGGHLFGH